MATFIKRVPTFQARAFTGLGSITELNDLAGRGGYRIDSTTNGTVLTIKTYNASEIIPAESDLTMVPGQVLVRDEAGTLTVMSGEDFALQYEVAP